MVAPAQDATYRVYLFVEAETLAAAILSHTMAHLRLPPRAFFAALLGVVLLAALATRAAATTVQFSVDPTLIGTTLSGDVDLFSSGLDGVGLQGQTLSLDLVLADTVPARLLLGSPTQFGVLFVVHTNAGTFPGLPGSTTGYLLDPSGAQMHAPMVAGRGQGSDGTFSAGLVSFTAALLGSSPVDISGVHFDITFPNTGYLVTDAQLRFSLQSENAVTFGTQLPEPSALLLLLIGLVGLVGTWSFVRRLRWPRRPLR